MNALFMRHLGLLALPTFLSGCAIGYDSALFMTKSNIGLDVDTKPPTAELSIARRELVIAPGFAGGQTPTVLAGFLNKNRALFGFDMSSVFAGGNAAAILSQEYPDVNTDASLCLNIPQDSTTTPSGRPLRILAPITLPDATEIRPFIFGSDTSFGLKVAWSGMTGEFPDSLKLGFQRKEIALAPVHGHSEKCTLQNNSEGTYKINIPSFLASIDIGATITTPQTTHFGYLQRFATGQAANHWASQDKVQEYFLARTAPGGETVKYDCDQNCQCLKTWLAPGTTGAEERAGIINEWWKNKGHPDKSWPALISGKPYASERSQFINDPDTKSKTTITCE